MFSTDDWNEIFFKIISIISFFLILVLLVIILQTGPASAYEFSIYDAYPWYFWGFLLSAIFCGQIVIIGSAITQSKKNHWFFGLFAIMIINAILLFLPKIRGYYVYNDGDVLTHIGYMKDILQTSGIGGDYYPIAHILGIVVHLFSGFSFADIIQIIPPFFSFFFIFSIYFVGKTIFQNKIELFTFITMSSVLMLGISELEFTPNAQALFFVPLFMYLAFKMYHETHNKKYNILLLLISFLIVFYHPLVTVMVILILFLMQIMQYILEKYEKKTLKKVNYLYTIFFIIVVFTMWSSYLSMATQVVEPIVLKIFGEEKIESELQTKVALVSQVNVDPFYIIKLILSVYGHWILLGILSLLSIGLIIKSMKNQTTNLSFNNGIPVLGFIVFFLLSIVMFFINGSFGFGRIYSFVCIFSLLVIPMGIYLFLYNNSKNNSLNRKKMFIKLIGIFFIFFCITYISTFNLYYSPIIKQANLQSPKSDHIGMNTFFSYRNESFSILEYGVNSFRFYDAIYGHSAVRTNILFTTNKIPPDHFGYQNETLSDVFLNNSKYLLMNDHGRGFYTHIYPEFEYRWRFVANDFERLKNDNKIQQVYSNRNLEIFIISYNR
jgi:hypothetical protein